MHYISAMAGTYGMFHNLASVVPPSLLTMHCPAREAVFRSYIRHNEIRDLTAKMLSEVCHSVATEPPLQPLSGESFSYRSAIVGAEARLDIKARGFLNLAQDAYFDVRVFHPNAPCYRSRDLVSVCKQHESAKKREYNQRIQNVEHGVFTPLVFTTTGSMGREGTTFYKRLADMLSHKQEKPYSVVMG